MTVKKFFIILSCVLAVVLLISLSVPYEENKNTVNFYYVRQDFGYGAPEGVIGPEAREVGEHQNDLNYLLALYLEGPMDKTLLSPFPEKAAQIFTVKSVGNALHIELSDLSATMTDGEFSLACACLTKTCLEVTKAQAVQVTSGQRSLRMTAANIVFYDESTSVDIAETEDKK